MALRDTRKAVRFPALARKEKHFYEGALNLAGEFNVKNLIPDGIKRSAESYVFETHSMNLKSRGVAMFKKIAIVAMYAAAISIFAGCGSTKPKAESWVLPKKESADSAMLIGRIDYPNNKTENPQNNKVYLSEVNFMTKDKKVYFGNGELNIELDNNYFVVPNLKPGKYYLVSFRTGKLFNQLPTFDDKYLIEVKPGQIKFVGSYDFLEYESSFLGAHAYKFNIRKAKTPSELEMFQWLNRVGAGSGWEPVIRKRIHELDGQP